MSRNVFLSPVFLALVAFTFPAPADGTETTLALCRTPSHEIRIYRSEGQTDLRALNRRDGIVWMNQTPVKTESTPDRTRYTNLRGEKTVILVVNRKGGDCTVQIGKDRPESGELLKNDAGETLDRSRELYPEPTAKIEENCPPPATLDVQSFESDRQPPRAGFLCWSAPDQEGSRWGHWLGNLPLTRNDPTFIRPFTCAPGDSLCATRLELLRVRYPDRLQKAEFQCSTLNGDLSFSATATEINIRCEFFDTTFLDTDNDGNPDNEDPVGVDISVGSLPVTEEK
ncbi:hypothetical protein V0288_13425 [Pannus brasiliensis CCIBt3594]|uniref:Uncharacterized protein n=1 Tax=Pannus brasiliensis CCIBt3594 TaxID=1427578 RepID=A0AAW9QWQ1_9CHRO